MVPMHYGLPRERKPKAGAQNEKGAREEYVHSS